MPDSEWFRNVNGHFKGPGYDSEKQKKLPQAKKNYWEYVKKHLFGDPDGTVKGLLDIKNLEENDIKEILSWILITDNQNKFAFLNIESNDSGETDIFNLPKNCFTTTVGDGLSRIDFCNLSKIESKTDREKLEFFVNDLLEYRSMILNSQKYEHESSNMQVTNEIITPIGKCQTTDKNKFKKIVAGIILIAIGILVCITDLLALGLASKLAVVLFLLSLLITVVGVVCLAWKKISDCVRSCVPISNSVLTKLESSSHIISEQSNDLGVEPGKFLGDEKQPK